MSFDSLKKLNPLGAAKNSLGKAKDSTIGSLKRKISKEPDYPEIFDTIIIGAGPAGMTAAVYAARRKLKALLICGEIGGQMMWASDIENYTGVGQATGPELTKQFFKHVKRVDEDNDHFDVWVREGEKVSGVSGSFKENFVVKTDSGKEFKAKTIVCTSGKIPRTLQIPGEKIAMQGNGLSFCATCDAPLYRNKKMVVIGGGNSAMDVALQLDKFTDDVTVMTNQASLIGEKCMMEKIEASDHIKVKYNIESEEIILNVANKVQGLKIKENGGDSYVFECEGIFEEIGQTPATDFLEGFIELNDLKEVPTDRKCNTSIPGFFAGGDCTSQVHKQVIVAAGEGALATLEAHEYILKN